MRLTSALIAVADIEKSKHFYRDVLEMSVVADFGANVTLDGGLVLQTTDTWKSFIRTDDVVLPNNAGELYFEEGDLDAFCDRLKTFDVRYVHPLFEHRWGQRVVRFHDPDGHIIEVAEKLDAVVARFREQGLSVEETAVRMDVAVDFVTACLNSD